MIEHLIESVRHLVQESSSDSEYLAAVEAGDVEKCQQMVDSAAKQAGYNIGPVYHGTDPASTFTTFRPPPTGALWFTDNWEYADFTSLDKFESGFSRVIGAYLSVKSPLNLRDQTGNQWDQIRDDPSFIVSAKRDGHDGIVLDDTNAGFAGVSWVVFSPSQIKLSDPITYDDSKNPIPLSRRFNPSSDDIRY